MRTTKTKKNLEEIVFNGKLPPQALELEEAVLGAVMLEKRAIDKVYASITADTFYSDANKSVWEAIDALYVERNPIDILTVSEKARQLGILENCGGAYYITMLTNRVSSAANIETHALLLVQKYIARLMINICGRYGAKFFEDGDPLQYLDDMIMEMNKVVEIKLKHKRGISWQQILNETMADIEKAMNQNSSLTGLPTGCRRMNELTGGWQKGDMIVIAGRPGMGKTAFALHLMMVGVKHGYKIKFYSLEMSYRALAMRILSSDSEIEMGRLKRGQITDDELYRLRQIEIQLRSLNVMINDNGRMTIMDLAADARSTKLTSGLDMIFLDYLGLLTPVKVQGQSREQQVSDISREIKLTAKELDIPFAALSQLSRANENNKDKRPGLNHLRDSGSIEQDADVVIFAYRPFYYTKGDMEKEPDNEYHSLHPEDYEKVFEANIEKNRNGTCERVLYAWDGTKQKFENV